MSGSIRRSCAKRRNALESARSPRRRRTHQVDPERSQTTRAAKRPYQAVSMTSRNVLGWSETSAPMKRTHQVEIQTQEGTWSCRGSRKSSRAIGAAQTLSTAPDTIGHTPGVTGARAASIRTRRVEETDQEASWASKADRETWKAIGSARAMATVSKRTGMDAGQRTQRAAHAATRFESIRVCWLQMRQVSAVGTNAIRRTYLGHPQHPPSTTDYPQTIRTHRVVVDV